jgi:E3 ubiquitin-protein ligase FANCL
VVIKLPPDYPVSAPICSSEMPEPVSIRWLSGVSTLADVVQQFQRAFEKYQDLWLQLDDLDQNVWILEPERPTYSTSMRRIALGNHCSLQITIDPKRPRGVPDQCKFFGADSIIHPLRQTFNKNIAKWDDKQKVRSNLESLLGMSFPSPKNVNKEEFSMECGICYTYRVGDTIPEVCCENTKCGKPFHRICLFDWLRAIPSSRIAFDTIFGQCPYCSSAISTKFN